MNTAWRLALDAPTAGAIAALVALVAAAAARRAHGWRAAAVRLAVGGLLAAALAEPVLAPSSPAARAVLVDASLSLAPGAAATAWPQGLSGVPVLWFGDRTESPLAAAIDVAAGAAAGGGLVVASDGAATDGAAAEGAARAAAARGVQVDAVALAGRAGTDAAVTSLAAPALWRGGETVSVIVGVVATQPVTGSVELALDGRAAHRAPAAIGRAPSTVAFDIELPPGSGPVRVEARVAAAGDREPANDRRHWVIQRAAPPRVLVIGDSAEAVGLADALLAAGLPTAVFGPTRLSSRLSAAAPWDVVVVVDLPAAVFGIDQLATLEALVAGRGHGLVLTGGRQSFLQGGWRGTALARLSPVTLEAPPHGDREAVALLLMIDRSASMAGGDQRAPFTKLDLAREAAVLATEVLQPGDAVGVLAYDSAAQWLWPLAPIAAGGGRGPVEDALRRLAAGGGTLIEQALAVGLPALAAADAPTRHAVLISDGRDAAESAAPLVAAVTAAHARGVTFSTLGVGRDADIELLARLAELGRGRAYRAVDAGDLPRLTVEESEIVRARAERSGAFRAQRTADADGGAMVAGVDIGALPELRGYLALRPRPEAVVALASPAGDPLLAGWQVGLGRVAAWTSDVGGAWAEGWPSDPAGRAALVATLRWAARRPGAAGIDAAAQTDDASGRTRVVARAVDAAGGPLDLAAATLVVTGTEGASRTALAEVAPGRYEGTITLPRPGAWPAAVEVARDRRVAAAALTVARGYPPELVPDGDAAARLARLAAAGGGDVVAPAAVRAPASGRPRPLWAWFAALAAALWPLDVGLQLAARRRRAAPSATAPLDPSGASLAAPTAARRST